MKTIFFPSRGPCGCPGRTRFTSWGLGAEIGKLAKVLAPRRSRLALRGPMGLWPLALGGTRGRCGWLWCLLRCFLARRGLLFYGAGSRPWLPYRRALRLVPKLVPRLGRGLRLGLGLGRINPERSPDRKLVRLFDLVPFNQVLDQHAVALGNGTQGLARTHHMRLPNPLRGRPG